MSQIPNNILSSRNPNVMNSQPQVGGAATSRCGTPSEMATLASQQQQSSSQLLLQQQQEQQARIAQEQLEYRYQAEQIAYLQSRYANVPANTCPQYSEEIIDHLLRREASVHRDHSYLASQPDVTDRMRMILTDWLVDVAIKFKVHPETFFLAVDIVDRFLMRAHVSRSQLQLVGVTAMLIAAKHEEIWAPEIRECIYISANTYTAEEVITMERTIASELNFKFTVPTAYPFFCNLLDRLSADHLTRNMSFLYLDCSALEYRMLEFLPSQIAGAACFLGLLTVFANTDLDRWIAHFEDVSFVPIAAVIDCSRVLLASARAMVNPTSRYGAIRRKFSTSKYDGVALMALPDVVPDIVFE